MNNKHLNYLKISALALLFLYSCRKDNFKKLETGKYEITEYRIHADNSLDTVVYDGYGPYITGQSNWVSFRSISKIGGKRPILINEKKKEIHFLYSNVSTNDLVNGVFTFSDLKIKRKKMELRYTLIESNIDSSEAFSGTMVFKKID